MFIATETTPNPEAFRFIPHARLTDGASWSFEKEGFDSRASALAAALFELPGVARVFIAADFVTVVRAPAGPSWEELRYAVISALAGHLASGAQAVCATAPRETIGDAAEAEIRRILGLYVRPAVARHGGEVLFDRFEEESGVLWIRMNGACGGCPSARLTLKAGVERIVRQHAPTVLRVEEVGSEALFGGGAASRERRTQPPRESRENAHATRFTHRGLEIARSSA
ncbi:MAG: NifU N-terminal domain-containing protein [Caulobacteraceae bacterium]